MQAFVLLVVNNHINRYRGHAHTGVQATVINLLTGDRLFDGEVSKLLGFRNNYSISMLHSENTERCRF